MAFAISGCFIGMAGRLWGYYLTYLRPVIFLNILVAAKLVLMCVLGGKGTVAGPVVGAVLFIAINECFEMYLGSSELNIVGTGLLMLVVLIFFPQGIVGTLKEHGKLPLCLDWDYRIWNPLPGNRDTASANWPMPGYWHSPGSARSLQGPRRRIRSPPM